MSLKKNRMRLKMDEIEYRCRDVLDAANFKIELSMCEESLEEYLNNEFAWRLVLNHAAIVEDGLHLKDSRFAELVS